MSDPDLVGLLMIGAYRDNEVHAGHPLQSLISALARARAPSQYIELAALDSESVGAVARRHFAHLTERSCAARGAGHRKDARQSVFRSTVPPYARGKEAAHVRCGSRALGVGPRQDRTGADFGQRRRTRDGADRPAHGAGAALSCSSPPVSATISTCGRSQSYRARRRARPPQRSPKPLAQEIVAPIGEGYKYAPWSEASDENGIHL